MRRSKQSETKIDLSLKLLDSHDDQEGGHDEHQSHSENQQVHEHVQQNIKEPDVDEAQEEEHLDDDIQSPRISKTRKDLKTQEVLALVY